MDDEKYFKFSNILIGIDMGLYAKELDTRPCKVRYASRAKTESKILVWAAISTAGISSLHVKGSRSRAISSKA